MVNVFLFFNCTDEGEKKSSEKNNKQKSQKQKIQNESNLDKIVLIFI